MWWSHCSLNICLVLLFVSQIKSQTCHICPYHNLILSLFMTYHGIFNKSETTMGVTSGEGTSSTPILLVGLWSQSLFVYVLFCWSLLVLLSLSCCHCMSLEFQLLITSLWYLQMWISGEIVPSYFLDQDLHTILNIIIEKVVASKNQLPWQ
jgi:hypothetical protein